MCVPAIACEPGIYRKDSQYRTLLLVRSWAAAPLSPGNLTRIRDLGKKSGSTRGKIATISIDDFELLFQIAWFSGQRSLPCSDPLLFYFRQ